MINSALGTFLSAAIMIVSGTFGIYYVWTRLKALRGKERKKFIASVVITIVACYAVIWAILLSL